MLRPDYWQLEAFRFLRWRMTQKRGVVGVAGHFGGDDGGFEAFTALHAPGGGGDVEDELALAWVCGQSWRSFSGDSSGSSMRREQSPCLERT